MPYPGCMLPSFGSGLTTASATGSQDALTICGLSARGSGSTILSPLWSLRPASGWDYPKHYMWDRNSKLAPLYDAMREMARSEGYPIVDIFRNMRTETERGNWDLRVRGLPDGEHTISDDSFDEFFGDDPAFFSNIHPNSRCMGLIADWEVEKLRELFGDRLPVDDQSSVGPVLGPPADLST